MYLTTAICQVQGQSILNDYIELESLWLALLCII